jgi:hypothetical protein
VKKRTWKIIVILVAVFVFLSIVLTICYRFGSIVQSIGPIVAAADRIDSRISSYIRENHGDFPASDNDLIRQNVIRKVKTDDMYEYFIQSGSFDPNNPDDKKGWTRFYGFDLLKISYGANPQEIDMVDGKLYKKGTHEEILLIDGPYGQFLKKDYYEPISVKWYKLMLEAKQ